QGGVGGAVDLLQQRPAQRRLAGANVAGDDDEAFAPMDGVLEQIERVGVRLAAIEILRIRSQAERLFGEAVIALVHVIGSRRRSESSASTARSAPRVSSSSSSVPSRARTARSARHSSVP